MEHAFLARAKPALYYRRKRHDLNRDLNGHAPCLSFEEFSSVLVKNHSRERSSNAEDGFRRPTQMKLLPTLRSPGGCPASLNDTWGGWMWLV